MSDQCKNAGDCSPRHKRRCIHCAKGNHMKCTHGGGCHYQCKNMAVRTPGRYFASSRR